VWWPGAEKLRDQALRWAGPPSPPPPPPVSPGEPELVLWAQLKSWPYTGRLVRIRIDRAQVLALYWETAWWLELG
jgi:hypothetical protein